MDTTRYRPPDKLAVRPGGGSEPGSTTPQASTASGCRRPVPLRGRQGEAVAGGLVVTPEAPGQLDSLQYRQIQIADLLEQHRGRGPGEGFRQRVPPRSVLVLQRQEGLDRGVPLLWPRPPVRRLAVPDPGLAGLSPLPVTRLPLRVRQRHDHPTPLRNGTGEGGSVPGTSRRFTTSTGGGAAIGEPESCLGVGVRAGVGMLMSSPAYGSSGRGAFVASSGPSARCGARRGGDGRRWRRPGWRRR